VTNKIWMNCGKLKIIQVFIIKSHIIIKKPAKQILLENSTHFRFEMT